MNNDVLLSLLTRILAEQEVPFSAIAQSARKELEVWADRKGCIVLERVGRGKCFRIADQKTLEWEIKRLSPNVDFSNLPARLQNLAKNSDTKAGEKTLDYSYYICKAVGESVLVNQMDVSSITKKLGCLALPVSENSLGGKCNAALLLVENQQMLDDLRWIPSSFRGIVLYYAGSLSSRLLNWIHKSAFTEIWHFPDYDAVGISNFANLINFVPSAQWYWIPNWAEKLSKFGNKTLRNKGNQDSMFEHLWIRFKENGFPDSKLETLMIEIRKQGKMLEQEVALI